jgi:hypothetical protein
MPRAGITETRFISKVIFYEESTPGSSPYPDIISQIYPSKHNIFIIQEVLIAMPDTELYHRLGSISSKLDSLHELLATHIADDKSLEQRVHSLEINQTRHATYITLTGATLGLALSKLSSLLKFN